MKRKKKNQKKAPTVRDELLRTTKMSPPAIAMDGERKWLRSDGTIDVCVLNDLLCHLIIQNQMILHAMFPRGMPVPSGKTPGGIILPH